VGPGRPGRGRRDAPRRGGRRRRARAGTNVRGAPRGLRAPPPRRSRRRSRADRPPRVRRQLDDGRPLRERRQGRFRRRLRPGEGANAAAEPHARLRREESPARALAHAPLGLAVRVGRLRLVRPARRASVRLRDDVRPRRAPEGPLVAPDHALGGSHRRRAPDVERRPGPPRRQVPRPRPRALRHHGDLARRLEPSDGEGLRRRPRTDAVAARRGGERRTRREPRSGRRSAALDRARRRDRGSGQRHAGPPIGRRRAGASLRAPREEQRPGGARGVRALPRSHGLRRPHGAPRPRARPTRRGEGSDDRATPPRGRGRREPQPAGVVDRQGRGARRRGPRYTPRDDRRAPGAGSVRARRRQLARCDPLLRARARARPGRRGRDALEGRALRSGGPTGHGARVSPAGARAPAAQRGPLARNRGRPSRRRARDRSRRDGRALRGPAVRRPRLRPRAHRSRDRAARRSGARALQAAAQAWSRLGQRPRDIAAYRAALDLAPEDTDMMRKLANVYAVAGERGEQLRLLKAVLELMPQAKDVRDEVAHIVPAAPRPDEQYARPAAEFLAKRSAPGQGQVRRSLVDLQVTTVFPNGLANRFHQVVYQPLTEAAAAESREYEFSYENDSQAVELRAARVYRSGGRVDEAIESGAGAMQDDPAVSMYTSARSYYVRFPRLEPGDLVEVQYRVEDVASRNEFADYFGELAYMQSAETIGLSEYILMTPKARTFYFNDPHVPGLERTVEERGEQRIYTFRAQNVPAMEREPLQPPWTEVLGHINVSTYKSWDDLGQWYWGLVRDQFVADDEVRRRAETLTQGLKDDRAKARAIYDYVVQKTRYVALEFGIHGFKPYRCAQIFARGFGDCKDKATLIVTMLGALGIKATPVVVRTANKGDIETTPASLAPFDHMIAYVPSL